ISGRHGVVETMRKASEGGNEARLFLVHAKTSDLRSLGSRPTRNAVRAAPMMAVDPRPQWSATHRTCGSCGSFPSQMLLQEGHRFRVQMLEHRPNSGKMCSESKAIAASDA